MPFIVIQFLLYHLFFKCNILLCKIYIHFYWFVFVSNTNVRNFQTFASINKVPYVRHFVYKLQSNYISILIRNLFYMISKYSYPLKPYLYNISLRQGPYSRRGTGCYNITGIQCHYPGDIAYNFMSFGNKI